MLLKAAPRAPVTCPCKDMHGPPTKILSRKHYFLERAASERARIPREYRSQNKLRIKTLEQKWILTVHDVISFTATIGANLHAAAGAC